MNDNTIILQPRYVADFQCDGSKCNAKCCGNKWRIGIDADTYKKYQRMQRKDKDLETVEQHFWWMLIDEGLGEEYRRFLERYLIEFGENWCWEQNIPCSGKPLSSIKWNR